MRTQMKRELLDEQMGNRSAEAYILNYAYERICNREDTSQVSNSDEYCGRGPRASAGKLVISWPGGNRPVSQFSWTSGSSGCPPFPALAIRCLEDTYQGSLRGGNRPEGLRVIELVLFTEYKRNGKLFQSHPS
jgi:hypothetical protein